MIEFLLSDFYESLSIAKLLIILLFIDLEFFNDKLFFEINKQLEDNNFLVKNGAIVDDFLFNQIDVLEKLFKGKLYKYRKENDINNTKESTQIEVSKVDDNKVS